MLSEKRKLYENRPPEGAKPARGGSKMLSGRLPDGSFAPVGPNLAAKAARKPSLGGSGGALGTLLALLEPSWGFLGRSWAPLGGRFGPSRGLIWTIWTMSVAVREIQQKLCFFIVFLGFQGLPERSESAPKSVRKASKTSLGTQDEAHEAQVGSESGS